MDAANAMMSREYGGLYSPPTAIKRNIGRCMYSSAGSATATIQFDVTREGKVRNAVAIEGEPMSFANRLAKYAMESWIYMPRYRNGIAVDSVGITETMRCQNARSSR